MFIYKQTKMSNWTYGLYRICITNNLRNPCRKPLIRENPNEIKFFWCVLMCLSSVSFKINVYNISLMSFFLFSLLFLCWCKHWPHIWHFSVSCKLTVIIYHYLICLYTVLLYAHTWQATLLNEQMYPLLIHPSAIHSVTNNSHYSLIYLSSNENKNSTTHLHIYHPWQNTPLPTHIFIIHWQSTPPFTHTFVIH